MLMLHVEIYYYSKRGWAYFRQKPLLLILDSKGKGEQKSGQTLNDLQDDTLTFHKGYFEMAILNLFKIFSKPDCMQMPHHT